MAVTDSRCRRLWKSSERELWAAVRDIRDGPLWQTAVTGRRVKRKCQDAAIDGCDRELRERPRHTAIRTGHDEQLRQTSVFGICTRQL
jgi:hypothetical protein